MSDDSNLPTTFSEPEAQRILARAAELEGSIGSRFTTEDLRQIAAKAGIDAHALERAIIETNTAMGQPLRKESPPLMKPGRIAMLAGIGAVLGALAIFADKIQPFGSSAIPVFLPSGICAAYLALRHPLREGFPGLLRELGVTFGAFTAAVAAIQGFDGASAAVAWSTMASALSCGILSLRGARPDIPLANTVRSDAR